MAKRSHGTDITSIEQSHLSAMSNGTPNRDQGIENPKPQAFDE